MKRISWITVFLVMGSLFSGPGLVHAFGDEPLPGIPGAFFHGEEHLERIQKGGGTLPRLIAEESPINETEKYMPGQGSAEDGQILGPGPHLLLDDYLIAEEEGLVRVVEHPQRDPAIFNPVVTGKEDGCFQPYLTVIRDAETGRFRIWYGHHVEDLNEGRSHVACLESPDGIHWERPARVLQDPAPIQFGVSVLDEGPGFQDPSNRYKLGWYMDGGLKIAVSKDGLDWKPLVDSVVIQHSHDINGIGWDSLRKRYFATVSAYREGPDWSGKRRITMHSVSQDLIHWAPAYYVITPDDTLDPGETQFYAMDGYLVRGDLMIGMVKVLRDDLKADDPPDPPEAYGVGYTALAWSRDGVRWVRDLEHFFDPHPIKGEWDHAHAWIDEQVLVGDQVYLYYGGYARGHKVNRFEERQIGLVRIKLDRYVARKPQGEKARLRTPVVRLKGEGLLVNVDASQPGACLKVQVLDPNGQPMKGFMAEDCEPISGDSINAPTRWRQPLSRVKGKPVRLEFILDRCSLYGFTLTASMSRAGTRRGPYTNETRGTTY